MPFAAIRAYLQNLDAVQAEANVQAAMVAEFPHLEQSARESRFRRWQRLIKPAKQLAARPASPGLLALAGIGYRHTPPRPTVPTSESIKPARSAEKESA